ncbi:MAG: single-stranded DNA-binding protein [Flavobacteriales bacterium]|nr:single-stranded DNA-binding protein [Flavobacteriales bacterium]MCB9167057.1 single-stranded DNA-binding protein [Flavobacteriales bacterium]
MNTLKNNVQLIGNLGNDPEIRETAGGKRMARMSVATNDSYRNQAGERIDDTQWHTVVAWGKQADLVQGMLRKGSHVVLQGRLVHRSFEGRDGQKRFMTEVVMNEFQVMDRKNEEELA